MADSDQPDDNTVSLHKTIISLRSRKICAIGTLSQAFVTRNGDLGFDIDTWEKTVVSWQMHAVTTGGSCWNNDLTQIAPTYLPTVQFCEYMDMNIKKIYFRKSK